MAGSVELRQRMGSYLLGMRTARNLTQEALAERSGLSVDAVRRIERGQLSPSLETLHKLAGGLDLSLETFFAGLDDGAPEPSQELCDLLDRQDPEDAERAFRVLRTLFDDEAVSG